MDMTTNTYFEEAYGEPRRDGPFSQWLTDSPPWDPMGANSQASTFPAPSVPQSSSTSHPFNSRAAQPYAGFSDWRSTGLPSASDCETVPGGDSGYGGSLMPSSIDNTSIQGEERINSSIPDVESELGGFHLASHDAPAGLQFVPDASGDFSTSPSSGGNAQMCKECNAPMRTKSEMNKHLQRHKKPHTCSYPDCSRQTNGFASNNDLVRHKRTVHGELANGRNFVCHHEPCNKKELKLWPRADNFRSHLQRVHKLKVKAEDDLRDYVHQQQQQSQDLEGIGTNLQDPESLDEESARTEYVPRRGHITDFPHISPPAQVTAQVPASMQVYNQNFLVPPQSQPSRPRHHLGRPAGPRNFQHPAMEDMKPALQTHSHTSPFQQPSQQNHRTTLSPTNSRVHYSPVENHSPRQSVVASSANASIQADSDSEGDEEDEDEEDESKESVVSSSENGSQSFQAVIEQLKDTKPAEQVEYLKLFSKELLQRALESQSQSMDESNDSSQSSSKPNTACSTCEKKFNRPCELRKHNKRHEKPYGCTWYQCTRTFGSKNDWKRHETNQHGLIETWNCPNDCSAAYNSREMFSKHLQNAHKITEAAKLERTIEESRQGSHCTKKFWCGFCNTLQTIATADGSSVSNQRFDHIDNHFMGRNGLMKVKIDEWQHMEDQADEIDHSTSKKNHLPEVEGDVGRKSKRQRAS